MTIKTEYQKQVGKYIYPHNNCWSIHKNIKGETTYYGTYPDFQTAIKVRDELIKHNWDKTKIQLPEDYLFKKQQKEYYKWISARGYQYSIFAPQKYYCGTVNTIEEALHYRDIILELYANGEDISNKRPWDYDLLHDNKYLEGLDYPLPERLELPEKTEYSQGSIIRRSDQNYQIRHGAGGNRYVCTCRTYEQAYYVKQELNKCDWDLDKLDEIYDNYPEWYTWLMNLYKYILPGDKYWYLVITENNSKSGKTEKIAFSKLEEALWERDLYVKYGFDDELVAYLADDTENPYYDMTLPPYPQRKIRRIKERTPRTDLFNRLFEIIQEFPDIGKQELCDLAGLTLPGLKIILKNEYDVNIDDFLYICLSGENPNEVLEQKPLVYNPDLSVHTHADYIHEHDGKFDIIKWLDGREVYFGRYYDKKTAKKVVKDLKKCNWDKSQLKRIQEKHEHAPRVGDKRGVYLSKYTVKKTGEVKVKWSVRKKINRKMHYFGTYKDKRVAELVRDLLEHHHWDKSLLERIKDYALYCIYLIDNCYKCKTKNFI